MARKITPYWEIPHDRVCLYRAESYTYHEGATEIRIHEYKIVQYTACGAWISMFGGPGKFVNLRAVKQWACATKDEAIVSLRARKARQLSIIAAREENARETIKLIDAGKIRSDAVPPFLEFAL